MGMQVVKGVRYSDADVEALGLKGGRRVVNGDKVTATTHRAIGVHVPNTTTTVHSTDLQTGGTEAEAGAEDTQAEDTQAEEAKAEEAKAEEAKAEEAKAEEAKAEEAKAEEAKAEDTKSNSKKAR